MRTEFTVTGMHCGACAAKVAAALENAPGVRAADVSLPGSAVVVSEGPPDESALRDAVRRVGDYDLRAAPRASSAPAAAVPLAADADSAPRESLYPLYLIVGYLLGVVALIAWATDDWRLGPMMRHFMAGFFLVFSFFKLLDLRGFVSAYRMYDIPARAVAAWAWAYPFVEIALGAAYLVNAWPVATNLATLVVMLVGAAGVLRAVLDRRRIRCACLGTALNLPMTKVTLIEDLVMAAMAGAMLALHAAG